MKQRIALLEKDGNFGAVGLVEGEQSAVVSSYDSRTSQTMVKPFDSIKEARKSHRDVVKLSRENNWNVFYSGQPNYG